MTAPITSFRDEYSFLSNFYLCQIIDEDGIAYPSVENAYQARKCLMHSDRILISHMTPAQAKKFGGRVSMIPDFDAIKQKVMKGLIYYKFMEYELLRQKLVQTGDAELIEGNTWGDRYWGATLNLNGNWVGDNILGQILMTVRAELS